MVRDAPTPKPSLKKTEEIMHCTQVVLNVSDTQLLTATLSAR